MSDWFKDGPYWRHPDSGDAGDLVYNTMSRIIDMQDKSEWAEFSLLECMDLLIVGKRWPDRLNYIPTGRSQTKMTRDPYIAFYCCAMFLGRPEYVEYVEMPWYCYSPRTWRWHRRLIKKPDKPWWKLRLRHYRDLAMAIKTSNNPNIIKNKEEAGL